MLKKYIVPIIESYDQKSLTELIEAGACSAGFTCHCHSGTNNTS